MTHLCQVLGMCPIKWNPRRERFELCYVRYIYSALMTLVLTIIDPISYIFLLSSFCVFDNASIQLYVSLLNYFTSYLALLTIHLAQSHSPLKLVNLCNEWRSLYFAIECDRKRLALQRFAMKRCILSFIMASVVVSAYVYFINFHD